MKDKISALCAWVYSGLVISGGIFGYVMAGSVISLIAGFSFGLLLAVSGFMISQHSLLGRCLAILASAALSIIFYLRFVKTLAWLPSGALAIVGLACLIALVWLWPKKEIQQPVRVKID